jgi:hypothetical protein
LLVLHYPVLIFHGCTAFFLTLKATYRVHAAGRLNAEAPGSA